MRMNGGAPGFAPRGSSGSFSCRLLVKSAASSRPQRRRCGAAVGWAVGADQSG